MKMHKDIDFNFVKGSFPLINDCYHMGFSVHYVSTIDGLDLASIEFLHKNLTNLNE